LVDAKGFATFKLFENGKVLVASINDSVLPADKTHVARSYFSSSNKKNAFNAKYQVVVGCFGVEENAHKLVKELHSKKIQAGISGVNQKGLHVVSCGGFDSKDDAAQLLASVKSEFPNAWVMAK
jgi:cell division septation protein DedD